MRGHDGSAAGSEPPPDAPLRDALRPSGPPRLELRVDHQPDRVVVQLEGELDILTVPKLGARIDELIRASAEDVALDLRAVRFIDSVGLRLLLNTRRRLARASRTLSVMCDEGPVLRLIELTRLTEILGVTNL